MNITLINVAEKLMAQDIILDDGAGVDALDARLHELMPVASWGYNFPTDSLSIEVPDGTFIPDLSRFGEALNDSP